MKNSSALFISEFLNKNKLSTPSCHLVLGSVLSRVFTEKAFEKNWTLAAELPFQSVPGLNPATAPGHGGRFVYLKNKSGDSTVSVQVGRLHGYEGLASRDAVAPVIAHSDAGVKSFLLTNASGSLQKNIEPGHILIVEDHVNLTGQNPLVGENHPRGDRFPDMSEAYNKSWNGRLESFLKKSSISTHRGIYLGLLGPSFETPGEIALFSRWGLHAVGFSTVWETIALNHAGARVAAASFVSNFGCGLVPGKLDHVEFEKKAIPQAEKTLVALFAHLDEEAHAKV